MSLKDKFQDVGVKVGRQVLKIGSNASKEILKEFGKAINVVPKGEIAEKNEFDTPKYRKGIHYGTVKEGLFNKKVYFPNDDWKHKLVIGATGAGKNTWAENYTVNCPHGVAFIDNAKGSSVDRIIRALPKERLRKTVVLDHSVKEYPLAVGNVKGADDIFENNKIVAHYEDFFITNFGIGDKYRTRKLIRYAMKATFAAGNMTLLDSINFVENEDYREHILNKIAHKREYKDVVEYWNNFENMSKGQQRQYIDPFFK